MMSKYDFKYLRTEDLLGILQDLPENTVVNVNQVGNLSVRDADTMTYLGYICFMAEHGEYSSDDDKT